MTCIQRACRPPLAYWCSRWPPHRAQLSAIDRLQTKLIASAVRLSRLPGELAANYVRRRNRHASRLAISCGRWSQFWCKRVVEWDDHLRRCHFPKQWSTQLILYHDLVWLEARRQLVNNGRPGVRIGAGRPTTRWEEGVDLARSIMN